MENRFYDLQFLEDFLALHVREFRLKIARKGERERDIFRYFRKKDFTPGNGIKIGKQIERVF